MGGTLQLSGASSLFVLSVVLPDARFVWLGTVGGSQGRGCLEGPRGLSILLLYLG